MKSTSIKISLDTRRVKSDGTYPLILRLTHKRKTTSIKTGFHFRKEDWNEETGEIRKSYSGALNIKRLNNEIQKMKAEALDNILKLGEKSKKASLSVKEVKQHISPSDTDTSFYHYSAGLIKELYSAERIGTARSYEGTVNALKTYNKGQPLEKNNGGNPKNSNKVKFSAKFRNVNYRELNFGGIDFKFLSGFENYYLASGNALNGLAVYMRTIRSIYNKAIKSGLAEKSSYPFSDYKIRTEPTQKRALDTGYLQKIISLELQKENAGFDARNYFLASYMMYGMNFADMAFLKKKDIMSGRINYRRRKRASSMILKYQNRSMILLTTIYRRVPNLSMFSRLLKDLLQFFRTAIFRKPENSLMTT